VLKYITVELTFLINHPASVGSASTANEEAIAGIAPAPNEDQEQNRNLPADMDPHNLHNHGDVGGVVSQDTQSNPVGLGLLSALIHANLVTEVEGGDEWRIELGICEGQLDRGGSRQAFWEAISHMEERIKEGRPMPTKIKIIYKTEEQNMAMEWETPCQ